MDLAGRMRPRSLDEFVGQTHLVGPGKVLRRMIESGQISSMIFWGPPGTGKTTLAQIVANSSGLEFYILSAVSAGKEQLKEIINKNKKVILFIDEIHRWNKAQQDALLPYVESGQIILIGATTENPSFEVISALLSRSRVFVLNSLAYEDLEIILDKAKNKLDKTSKELLIRLSGGDARVMLNALELCGKKINKEVILDVFQKKSVGIYDKKADEHYNTISAFIKSMRGSDTDGALYYMMRMLENGEDPKFIARRMIIFASEDIGMADRSAIIVANGCFDGVIKIGLPEAQLILAHGVIYLSQCKKSRAVVNALEKVQKAVKEFPNEPIPLHLRNAPTKLMKELGYAKDYKWSEKYVGPVGNKSFLPEKLIGKKFFEE